MTGYLAPAGFGEAELIQKKSRFIGRVWPAECEAEVSACLAETRKKYWDATHHVSAYLLREGGVMRCSDDGEPGGTAGMPVLNVFRAAGIWNVCCVVTRYFGGTLLGAGGLVRAYSAAARLALEAAGTAHYAPWALGRLLCTYAQYERLRRLLEERGAAVENAAYDAQVTLEFCVPEEDADALALAIRELSAGSVELEYHGKRFRARRTPE